MAVTWGHRRRHRLCGRVGDWGGITTGVAVAIDFRYARELNESVAQARECIVKSGELPRHCPQCRSRYLRRLILTRPTHRFSRSGSSPAKRVGAVAIEYRNSVHRPRAGTARPPGARCLPRRYIDQRGSGRPPALDGRRITRGLDPPRGAVPPIHHGHRPERLTLRMPSQGAPGGLHHPRGIPTLLDAPSVGSLPPAPSGVLASGPFGGPCLRPPSGGHCFGARARRHRRSARSEGAESGGRHGRPAGKAAEAGASVSAAGANGSDLNARGRCGRRDRFRWRGSRSLGRLGLAA